MHVTFVRWFNALLARMRNFRRWKLNAKFRLQRATAAGANDYYLTACELSIWMCTRWSLFCQTKLRTNRSKCALHIDGAKRTIDCYAVQCSVRCACVCVIITIRNFRRIETIKKFAAAMDVLSLCVQLIWPIYVWRAQNPIKTKSKNVRQTNERTRELWLGFVFVRSLDCTHHVIVL